MEVAPQLLEAQVMHKRLFPKQNAFTYRVYYLVIPLAQLHLESVRMTLPVNRSGLIQLREQDHGAKDGMPLMDWARQTLSQWEHHHHIAHIMLVTMPRILGYGFNPVSFWLCLDEHQQLRAVINQVNNTFGETHTYLCAHEDGRIIHQDDWLESDKLFHVSPFLPREGGYRFRYAIGNHTLGIWIDYLDANGNTQLLTSLSGSMKPLTRPSLRAMVWRYPLVTLKTIGLIHWQALKLFTKGIRYIDKPVPLAQKMSLSRNLTKL